MALVVSVYLLIACYIHFACDYCLCVKVGRIEQSRTHKEYRAQQLVSFKKVGVSVRDYKVTIEAERDLYANGSHSEQAFKVLEKEPGVDLSGQSGAQITVFATLESKEKKAYTQIAQIGEAIH